MVRRGKWRARLFSNQTIAWDATGECVLAPVLTMADLIDVCATVAFVNNDSSAHKANTKLGALRATAVMARRVYGHRRSQVVVVFRTLSGALPSTLQTSSKRYMAPGSSYELVASESEPEDASNRRRVSTMSIEESICEAIHIAGSMIHESPDPASLFFKDAVASRLRLFHKSRLSRCPTPLDDLSSRNSSDLSSSESDSDDSGASPVVPATEVAEGAPSPPPKAKLPKYVESIAAFQRPVFESVEELFYSFATHTTDPDTGKSRLMDPLRTTHFRDQAQALIFCYKLC